MSTSEPEKASTPSTSSTPGTTTTATSTTVPVSFGTSGSGSTQTGLSTTVPVSFGTVGLDSTQTGLSTTAPATLGGFTQMAPGTSTAQFSYSYVGRQTTYSRTSRRYSTRGGPYLYPTPTPTVDPSFVDTCNSVKVRDIVGEPSEIIIVKSNESITDAFQTLIEHNILAAPVLDTASNTYIAFMNLLDIVSYLVDVYQFQTTETIDPKLEELILQDRFRNTPVSSLGLRSWRNPWYTISQESTEQDAIDMFSRTRADQIAVFDNNGNFVNILTQYMLVHWLAQRPPEEIGQLDSKSVQTFRLGYQRVVRVHKNRPVLHSFIRMDDIGVSGVAVTDDGNRVIGNISTTDLKDIGGKAENFRKLYLDCGTFLSQKEHGKGIPQLLYVHRDQPIRDVLDMFLQYNIHRVYVVERDDFRPVGVISDGDIINLFAMSVPVSGFSGSAPSRA